MHQPNSKANDYNLLFPHITSLARAHTDQIPEVTLFVRFFFFIPFHSAYKYIHKSTNRSQLQTPRNRQKAVWKEAEKTLLITLIKSPVLLPSPPQTSDRAPTGSFTAWESRARLQNLIFTHTQLNAAAQSSSSSSSEIVSSGGKAGLFLFSLPATRGPRIDIEGAHFLCS